MDDDKGIVFDGKGQSLDGDFVVFDLETTGFSPLQDKIIEIGAVKIKNGEIVAHYSTFVNPGVPIPYRIEQLTGINDGMVAEAPPVEEVLPEFLEFCKGCMLVAHNAEFDISFIRENCDRQGSTFAFTSLDTVGIARFLLPSLNRFKLDTVAKALGVSLENHHRAVDDAACTAQIFQKLQKMLKEREIFDVDTLNRRGASSPEMVKKLPTYHAIILVQNETGPGQSV